MEKTLNTDVLIVGAGPTGLMAACQLMRFGIDFILIDSKDGPTKESRAIAVTARSMEIYQQMGLDLQAIAGGKMMKFFNLLLKGECKAEVRIGEIGKGLSAFSYLLAFEQSKNEELLSQHVISQGGKIHWNHEFIELNEYQEGIRAIVQYDHEMLEVSAKYLIACDGASSPVRQQLGFSFKGGTYAHKFFVADTAMKWKLGYDTLIISPGDQNFCAFLPLKDDQTYRVIGTLPKKYFKEENISFGDIENVVKDTIHVDVNFETVNWFATYKLHHRRVDQFSTGRVFLAGDSAHIHSPAGGQGMNTGLQDAYNICWKLAMVLKNQAHPSLLDTYNEERLPFAKWLLRFTDRGFLVMTSRNWFIRFFRNHVALKLAGMLLSINRIRIFAFKVLSQTGYSYAGRSLSKSYSKQKLSLQAGDRLPYFPGENIHPLFTGASFHMLHIDGKPLDEGMQQEIKNAFPFPIHILEDQGIEKWKKLGVKKELFILVRPDNYMAMICDSFTATDVSDYLEKYFIQTKD